MAKQMSGAPVKGAPGVKAQGRPQPGMTAKTPAPKTSLKSSGTASKGAPGVTAQTRSPQPNTPFTPTTPVVTHFSMPMAKGKGK